MKVLCLRENLQHVLITYYVPDTPHERDFMNVPAEGKALTFLGP